MLCTKEEKEEEGKEEIVFKRQARVLKEACLPVRTHGGR